MKKDQPWQQNPPEPPGGSEQRKLQRPPGRESSFSNTNSPFYTSPVHTPPPANNWNGPYPGPPPAAPPPYQHPPPPPPSFNPHHGYTNPQSPPPFQPAPYIHHIRSEHPTPTLKALTDFPRHPAHLPPFPPPGQIFPPWSAKEPQVAAIEDRAYRAVPMYELPPADLWDYDMTWMVGIRMLPEWNRLKEDRHWDEVRRMRYDGMMQEREGDKDLSCVVM